MIAKTTGYLKKHLVKNAIFENQFLEMKNKHNSMLPIYILALTALTFLTSCDNFDLVTITDFEWSSPSRT